MKNSKTEKREKFLKFVALLSYKEKPTEKQIQQLQRLTDKIETMELSSIDASDFPYTFKDSLVILSEIGNGFPTMEQGGLNIIEDQPFGKQRIPEMALVGGTGIVKGQSCKPLPEGPDAVITEHWIEDFVASSMTEICFLTIQNSIWRIQQDLGGPMAASVFDVFIKLFRDAREEEMDQLTWEGDSALTSFLGVADGFLKLFTNGTGAQAIWKINAAAHTDANVDTAYWNTFAKMFAENPTLNSNPANFKFYANPADRILIQSWIRTKINAGEGTNFVVNADGTASFMGVSIIFDPYIPVNSIIFARPEDLWVKTTLEKGYANLDIYPAAKPDKNIIIESLFTWGMAYKWGKYVVWSNPLF
jgi:hypothetical protein